MKAIVKNVGIFVGGIAAKVVFDYGYKKTKRYLNNRKNKKLNKLNNQPELWINLGLETIINKINNLNNRRKNYETN